MYSDCGKAHDGEGSSSFGNNTSSSQYFINNTVNCKNNFLVLLEGPTNDIND